jgi:hypothetical protein
MFMVKNVQVRLGTATILMLTLLTGTASAQEVTMETLLDRIQIEDLLVRYYYELSQGWMLMEP